MTIEELDQNIKHLQELLIEDILKNHGVNYSSAKIIDQISILDRKRAALVFIQNKVDMF